MHALGLSEYCMKLLTFTDVFRSHLLQLSEDRCASRKTLSEGRQVGGNALKQLEDLIYIVRSWGQQRYNSTNGSRDVSQIMLSQES